MKKFTITFKDGSVKTVTADYFNASGDEATFATSGCGETVAWFNNVASVVAEPDQQRPGAALRG